MSSQASATFLIRARELLPAEGDELAAALRELPPLAIVVRILGVVDRVAADPRAGRLADDGEPFAVELDDVAASIAALWGPRGEWVGLALRLDDAGVRAAVRASSPSTSVRGSDRDAWEPMEDDDLAPLVARSAAAGLLDAAEAYVPFALWMCSLANAALLRAADPESRLTLKATAPHATLAEQGAHRALVLAGLARLRRLVERGFPGVAARMQSTRPRARGPTAGPYRAHVAALDERPDEVASGAGTAGMAGAADGAVASPSSPFRAALDAVHIGELFDEAAMHALRAALCDRDSAEVDGAHRSIFRSERVKTTEQRATAERAALPTVRARGILRVIERGFFPVALHEAVVELCSAAGGFAVEETFLQEPIVRHLARAGRAVNAVTALLGLQLGLAGDESVLAAAVAGHLAMTGARAPENAFEELVHALSQVLAGTTFGQLHASLLPLARGVDDAERGAASADARVHWYERIRIFGEGPGVIERDAHKREADSGRKTLATTTAAVRGYLEGALRSVHPQALVYYRTFDLRASLGLVRLVEVVDLASARDVSLKLEGDVAFRAHLDAWTGDLLGAFGHLSSPGEVFEEYAAGRLRELRSSQVANVAST